MGTQIILNLSSVVLGKFLKDVFPTVVGKVTFDCQYGFLLLFLDHTEGIVFLSGRRFRPRVKDSYIAE